jgi:uncharacterized membrane protein YccC
MPELPASIGGNLWRASPSQRGPSRLVRGVRIRREGGRRRRPVLVRCAELLANPIPVFAPLAALLTVQTTVWESVSRGAQRVAGVIIGVIVAFGFARLAGIHAWSITLVIFAALLVGRALRLGVQGAIQVPVSALLVLAVGGTRGSYGRDRIIDTLTGAAIGVVISLVPAPSAVIDEATSAVASFARELRQLLGSIAEAVTGRGERDAPLRRARLLSERSAAAADAIDQARVSTRLNPMTRTAGPAVVRLTDSLETLRLVELQVRGMARAVADAQEPVEPAPLISSLLTAVRDRVDGWADQVEWGQAAEGTLVVERLSDEVIRAARDPALSERAAATAIAIAVDARRACDELVHHDDDHRPG